MEPVPIATESPLDAIAGYLGTTATGPVDAGAEPVTIGWVTIGSGPFAQPDVDTSMLTAVRLLNERFNGIGGRPIVVRRFLVDGSAEQSRAAGEQLLVDPAVSLVVEGSMAAGGAALHDTFAGRIPVAVMSPIGPHDLDSSNAYCLTPGAAAPAPAFVHYLTEVLDAHDVSVVRVAFDRTSDPIEAAIRAGMERRGGVARVGYYGALDRSPLGWVDQAGVDRACADSAAADADAIVLLGIPHPDPVVYCARALDRIGFDGPVLAIPFGLTDEVRNGLGDLPRWTYMCPDPLIAAPDPSGHTAAYRAALREYRPEVDPETLFVTAIPAFGSVITLARILAPFAADDLDRAAAGSALAGYRGPVFLGPPRIPPRDSRVHPAVGSRAARWYRYDGAGQWSLAADWVEPAAAATESRP